MINVNDFRTGTTIELEGEAYTVIEFLHVKPGKGSAFVRSKLKNVRTGSIVERTFRGGETVARAHLDKRTMQFLYQSGDEYTFMDLESYEQLGITAEQLGEGRWFLKENMECSVLQWQAKVIGVELPNTVELEVVETDPGFKGDTATGGTKPAKLETGYIVKVPLFINVGDRLKIDSRTGAYISRA